MNLQTRTIGLRAAVPLGLYHNGSSVTLEEALKRRDVQLKEPPKPAAAK